MTPDSFQRLLKRQQNSGLSIRRFCRKENLAEATFYYWRRRHTLPLSSSEFLELPLIRKPSPSRSQAFPVSSLSAVKGVFVLHLGSLRLEVAETIGSESIRRLLHVLKETGLC